MLSEQGDPDHRVHEVDWHAESVVLVFGFQLHRNSEARSFEGSEGILSTNLSMLLVCVNGAWLQECSTLGRLVFIILEQIVRLYGIPLQNQETVGVVGG